MKKIMEGCLALLAVALMCPAVVNGQNEFTVNGKADFVTDYIWRGADQNSGFSVQPSLNWATLVLR